MWQSCSVTDWWAQANQVQNPGPVWEKSRDKKTKNPALAGFSEETNPII